MLLRARVAPHPSIARAGNASATHLRHHPRPVPDVSGLLLSRLPSSLSARRWPGSVSGLRVCSDRQRRQGRLGRRERRTTSASPNFLIQHKLSIVIPRGGGTAAVVNPDSQMASRHIADALPVPQISAFGRAFRRQDSASLLSGRAPSCRLQPLSFSVHPTPSSVHDGHVPASSTMEIF